MRANQDIRQAARRNGVRLWRIADRLGIHDSNLSRKMKERTAQRGETKNLRIIEEIAEEDYR